MVTAPSHAKNTCKFASYGEVRKYTAMCIRDGDMVSRSRVVMMHRPREPKSVEEPRSSARGGRARGRAAMHGLALLRMSLVILMLFGCRLFARKPVAKPFSHVSLVALVRVVALNLTAKCAASETFKHSAHVAACTTAEGKALQTSDNETDQDEDAVLTGGVALSPCTMQPDVHLWQARPGLAHCGPAPKTSCAAFERKRSRAPPA